MLRSHISRRPIVSGIGLSLAVIATLDPHPLAVGPGAASNPSPILSLLSHRLVHHWNWLWRRRVFRAVSPTVIALIVIIVLT